MKINKFTLKLLVLIGMAIITITLGVTLGLPTVRALDENAFKSVRAKVGTNITLEYAVKLPDDYTDPQMDFNGTPVTDYVEKGENIVFSYENVPFSDISKPVIATLKAKNGLGEIERVSDYSHSAERYLRDLLQIEQTAFDGSEYQYLTMRSFAVNALNFGAKLQTFNGATENLITADYDGSLVFSHDDNVYKTSRWGERDNPFDSATSDTDGFTWVSGFLPVIDDDGVKLKFSFTVTDGLFSDLNARLFFAGKTYKVIPEEVLATGTSTTYSVISEPLGITDFSSKLGVQIYDGDIRIGKRALCCVNQSIAWVVDRSGTATNAEKDMLRALYGFGKASSLFAYSEDNVYSEFKAIYDDEGKKKYVANLFDYSAEYTSTQTGLNIFGHEPSLIIGQSVIKSSEVSSTPYQTTEYTVSYADNAFNVTLNGGQIDGGLVALYTSMNITVSADTSVSGSVFRDTFDYWNKKGCAIGTTVGSLSISGNAKLFVDGGITTGSTLTVSNAKITVTVSHAGHDGVTANGRLDITDNAELAVNYTGVKPSTATSVVAIGDVKIDGAKLSTDKFNHGVYLNGEETQKFTVTGESIVDIKAIDRGLYGSEKTYNRVAEFINGQISVKAGVGVDYFDLTLTEAELLVTATMGKGIGHTRPCKITTDSGDVDKGSLTVINQAPFNAYYDKTATVHVSEMNVNGGKLNFSTNCRDTIIELVQNGVYNFANTDVILGNSSIDLTDANSNNFGINAGVGGITINVDVSAWLIIKNTVMPIWCYNGATACTVTLNGRLIVDGYRSEIWSWMDNNVQISGSAEVEYRNKIEVNA